MAVLTAGVDSPDGATWISLETDAPGPYVGLVRRDDPVVRLQVGLPAGLELGGRYTIDGRDEGVPAIIVA